MFSHARNAAVVLCGLAGCSLGMRTDPPSWTPATEPRCSRSASAPVADGVLATVLIVVGAGIATAGSDCTDDDCDLNGLGELFGGVTIATGAVFAVGTLVGLGRRQTCKEHVEGHRQWRAANGLAPTPTKKSPRRDRYIRRTVTDDCQASVTSFKDEKDPRRKSLLMRDMPEHCREQLYTREQAD